MYVCAIFMSSAIRRHFMSCDESTGSGECYLHCMPTNLLIKIFEIAVVIHL